MLHTDTATRFGAESVRSVNSGVETDQALNVSSGVRRNQESGEKSSVRSVSHERRGFADVTLVRDLAITAGAAVGLMFLGTSFGWAIAGGAIVGFGFRAYRSFLAGDTKKSS